MMYFAAVAVIIATTLAFVLFASGESDVKNIEFLKNYGWETDTRAVEREEITIPCPLDRVYENYNEIQLRAGLDISRYAGKDAVRFTYIVKNYPCDVGEEVRANVICVGGEPVAGDIMTVSVNGFMHSLRFDDAKK